MSFRLRINNYFFENIFKPLFKSNPNDWRVLVLDKYSTNILNNSFKMHDIMELGITLVDSLYKIREPLPLEGIYIMEPTKESVECLVRDFSEEKNVYKHAHVYFLHSCPKELLRLIAENDVYKYLKTLQQLDMAYIAVESNVYSLDCRLESLEYPKEGTDYMDLEKIANRLSTLCASLGEYPKICYRKSGKNEELAKLVQQKMNEYKKDQPNLGVGLYQDQSVLLILDRGFDPVSPLLHEVTIQAMAYDLMDINNGVYTVSNKISLDVTDREEFWRNIRHENVGKLTEYLVKANREFASHHSVQKVKGGNVNKGADFTDERSAKGGDDENLKTLIDRVRILPQYQKEFNTRKAVNEITQTCVSTFRSKLEKIALTEQNLVMNEDEQRDKLEHPMRHLAESLGGHQVDIDTKLRLILIYILTQESVNEDVVDKMFDSVKLSCEYKRMIVGLSRWMGARIVVPKEEKKDDPMSKDQTLNVLRSMETINKKEYSIPSIQSYLPNKGRKFDDEAFTLARWRPFVCDLMEQAVTDKMNTSAFPVLRGASFSSSGNTLNPRDGISARFLPNASPNSLNRISTPVTTPDKTQLEHCGPRLIICVVGGVTWSETRSAYQFNTMCQEARSSIHDDPNSKSNVFNQGGGTGWNWEVVIGGTHMISPKEYLEDLQNMEQNTTLPTKNAEMFSAHFVNESEQIFQY